MIEIPSLIDELAAASSDSQVLTLIARHSLTLDTIQQLKDYSAKFYSSNPTHACHIGEQAFKLGRHLPAPATALASWTLANALLFANQYASAFPLFESARDEFLQANDLINVARLSVGYVIVLAFLGHSQQALDIAAAIEPILVAASSSEPADGRRVASLLINIGLIHELLGQYEESVAVYERQSRIAQNLDDPLLLAQSLHNQACALMMLNDYDEAFTVFAEAEKLFIASAAYADLVHLEINYIVLLTSLKRFADAQNRLQRAWQFVQESGEAEQQQIWLTLSAIILNLEEGAAIGDAQIEALHRIQASLSHQEPAFGGGLVWLILGRCHLQRAEWQAANTAFGRALKLAEQRADRTLAQRAWHGLGIVAANQNKIKVAIHAYRNAIRQIEAARAELNVEVFRASFLSDKLVVYHALARIYLDQQQPKQAFQIVERAKSRLLAEKLAFRLQVEAERLNDIHSATASESRPTNPALDADVQELRTALAQLETLYPAARMASATATPITTDALDVRSSIITLERTVQTLTRRIQRTQPLFSATASGQIATLRQTCAQLPPHHFLVYYTVIGDEIGAFVLNRRGIVSQQRLTTTAIIASLQQALMASIERALEVAVRLGMTRAASFAPSLIATTNKRLQELYNLLLRPLLVDLPTAAPLLIVPDGLLHLLPFHALHDGNHYLLEDRTISYCPSATLLDLCLRAPSQNKNVLLLGFDEGRLQATTAEIDALAELFSDATHDITHSYVAQAATSARFLDLAAQQRILHLATHAHFRADNPMLSALALADRGLTLAEIARLPLDADLVVLSGCETGYGQLRGADLLSLAGGFLGAGARSLLVSLWRVEDLAAAQIIQHFYQSLLAGHSRSAALREAQIALLEQGRNGNSVTPLYGHIAFWGPFFLLGNWQPLDFTMK